MEYREVYFRIRSSYQYDSGWLDEGVERAFREESRRLFQTAGWELHPAREGSSSSDTVTKGQQDLYLHPMNFSGVIQTDEIPRLQELLEGAQTFQCQGVDCYERYWELTDEEYLAQLESKRGEIMQAMLTLGIPGSTACAVMLGGMMIHGLLPGNDLFTVQAGVIYPVMSGMFFSNLAFMLIGIICAKYFAYIARVPLYILIPIIVVFCAVGAFAISNSMVDVYVMILFGLVGFFLIHYNFDVTPAVLGLILGPIAEKGLGRAIMINHGIGATVINLFTSPICVFLLAISIISLFAPLIREYRSKKQKA